MNDRVMPFAGIHNFRDYGGYQGRDGQIVRGKFYRSGQHHTATAADLVIVDDIGITTVVDLRGDSERRRYPCARGVAFAAQVLFADGETAGAGGAAHAVAAREVKTADDAFSAMIDLYSFMPRRPNLQAVLRQYLTSLAEDDGANLIHCFAGKDRTGLAVALVHRLMGVHHDDVMADYLLTNTAGNSAARIAAGAESIRRSQPAASDEAVARLMSVDAAYLYAAFATIDGEWGSPENYARDVLDADGARLEKIRVRMIA
jgi:protein-tyrosine phosphatase